MVFGLGFVRACGFFFMKIELFSILSAKLFHVLTSFADTLIKWERY